jgi:protein BCP1
MAKRKSKADPEELPDAADKSKQQDDDDSGSDEVCDNFHHPRNATQAHKT